MKAFFPLLSLLFLFSCSNNTPTLPSSTGAINEVVIVMDEYLWQGAAGDSIRATLGADVAGLAWQEPIFDLVQVPKKAFSRIFQTHRNVILFEKTSKANVGHQLNMYSQGQYYAEVTYTNTSELLELIHQYADVLTHQIQKKEQARLQKRIALAKELDGIYLKHGTYPPIPKRFSMVLDTTNFSWLEYSPKKNEIIEGVFIYTLPFETIFSAFPLLKARDSVLQLYVPGELEGSYMATEAQYSPWVRYEEGDSNVVLEIKSQWKMQNAFMGGPFVSKFLLDSASQSITVVEAFLFNPGKNKRDHMQQLQLIVDGAKKQISN